jgi:GH25 family lysozyme M1 (1,4-beta-N-acetylmuramidase)
MATINGIDIASYQETLVPSKMTTTAFIIVKATGGTGYVNPCFRKHADQTLAANKLLGCYHFAQERGCAGSAKAEADYFVKQFEPYIGKAIPFLDWEADALALDPSWAKAWCDRVYSKTGVKPGIYMSKSTCNAHDWSAVAKAGYFLWVAQYPDYSETGYNAKPWTDGSPFGAWGYPELFQYTSCGKIKGYSGRLDLDLFYGTAANWGSYTQKGSAVAKAAATAKAAVSNAKSTAKTVVVSRANVAAQIMEHLCTCPEHGYSQPGRYGTSGYCSVKTDVGTIKVKKGDRDCTSAVGEAWELALEGTPYAGKISKTVWTGNMIEMFVGSGLFDLKPMSFDAMRGDVYHVHNSSHQHAAMCTQNDASADLLAEFSIAETGDIDGEPGDQTGKESSVHAFYDGFSNILHYNGKADTTEKVTTTTTTTTTSKAVVFRVSTDAAGKTWLKKGVTGKAGKAIRWIAIKGVGKYRVCTRDNGWLPWVTKFNVKDLENGCAGDGSEIIGIQIESDDFRYAARPKNRDWYSDMVGLTDTGGSGDNFAGDLANAIDGFRVSRA